MERRLYIAGFIILFMALVAAASDKLSTYIAPATELNTVDKTPIHQFDTNGVCTCIPYDNEEELESAPKLELNSSLISFVKNYNTKNGKQLDIAKQKKQKYFTLLDSVLRENEVPAELKYLAFIESGMELNPTSRTGAIGPWALMPDAAKRYGLKVGKNDERLSYAKSTAAAAKILKDMYEEYGDWLTAIAAYNCGPGTMQRAIKKAGSNDYWKVQNFLPEETRRHTKKFIAIHYHFEGHGSIVTITKSELEKHLAAVATYTANRHGHNTVDSIALN